MKNDDFNKTNICLNQKATFSIWEKQVKRLFYSTRLSLLYENFRVE